MSEEKENSKIQRFINNYISNNTYKITETESDGDYEVTIDAQNGKEIRRVKIKDI